MKLRSLVCLVLLAAGFATAMPNNCPPQQTHTYALGFSSGFRTATNPVDEMRWGYVAVWDTNTSDCNGDMQPGEFDGDYDAGLGGGFFGYGPWADEPTCEYDLNQHGPSVVVSDFVFGPDIRFAIGADDMAGPVVTVDPVTGATTCETDGAITPGDPAVDPWADADDCLTPTIDGGSTGGWGTTCGAGGDGGYWVFLFGSYTETGAGNVVVSNPPTAGTISSSGVSPASLLPHYGKFRQETMFEA